MSQRPSPVLGTDTFAGADDGGSRASFFHKTTGQLECQHSGLLRVTSPVSGHLLTAPDGSGPHHHAAIRDPLTGTVLKLDGSARIVTPVMPQPQGYSRKFYLTKDVDIAIATIRATTKITDKTNEKVGTSGSATGKQSSSAYPAAAAA